MTGDIEDDSEYNNTNTNPRDLLIATGDGAGGLDNLCKNIVEKVLRKINEAPPSKEGETKGAVTGAAAASQKAGGSQSNKDGLQVRFGSVAKGLSCFLGFLLFPFLVWFVQGQLSIQLTTRLLSRAHQFSILLSALPA